MALATDDTSANETHAFTLNLRCGVLDNHPTTDRFWVRCPETQSYGRGNSFNEASNRARLAANVTVAKWYKMALMVSIIPNEITKTWIDNQGGLNWDTAGNHSIQPIKFWVGTPGMHSSHRGR